MEPSGDDVEGKLGGVVGVDMGVVTSKDELVVATVAISPALFHSALGIVLTQQSPTGCK